MIVSAYRKIPGYVSNPETDPVNEAHSSPVRVVSFSPEGAHLDGELPEGRVVIYDVIMTFAVALTPEPGSSDVPGGDRSNSPQK